MRLTEYTDYTLRVLMYCAAHPGRLVTIAELAERHGLSKNHLMKIVNDLARQGVLETTRGRGGGMRLKTDATQIIVGEVVRHTESDFRIVECFDEGTNACLLSPTCRLKRVFDEAMQAYFKVLDGVTLADIADPAPAMPPVSRLVPLRAAKPVTAPTRPAALRRALGVKAGA